ncbi:hypothetical protein GCM10023203_37880 [Actinomycetospora straminea]|uniref:Uncharacterized protein n=1 Tax=Actinomycetospora straminea TaxID=663607 RepID=A0ABP9ESL3_9PSEU
MHATQLVEVLAGPRAVLKTPAATSSALRGGAAALRAWGLHADRGRAPRRGHRLGALAGSTVGSCLGLVPSEFSSGASRVHGGITNSGNGRLSVALPGRADLTAELTPLTPSGTGGT